MLYVISADVNKTVFLYEGVHCNSLKKIEARSLGACSDSVRVTDIVRGDEVIHSVGISNSNVLYTVEQEENGLVISFTIQLKLQQECHKDGSTTTSYMKIECRQGMI